MEIAGAAQVRFVNILGLQLRRLKTEFFCVKIKFDIHILIFGIDPDDFRLIIRGSSKKEIWIARSLIGSPFLWLP